jgi:hypothetical protein
MVVVSADVKSVWSDIGNLFHAPRNRLDATDVAYSRQDGVVAKSLSQRDFYVHTVLDGYECCRAGYHWCQIVQKSQSISYSGFVGAHHVVKAHIGNLERRSHDAVGYECAVAPELGLDMYAVLADGIVVGATYYRNSGMWILG